MTKIVKQKREAYMWEVLAVIVFTMANIMYAVIPAFDSGIGDVHIPLLIGAVLAGLLAVYRLGYTWEEVKEGIVANIIGTMQAILILAIIGMIIGTWMQGGVVPTLIYYGLQILSPGLFLVAACILCSVISLATGSSWTTAGTVGIALMGVAAGLGVPAPMAAGAIISGSYFGDKMSPLSDTTNLAPAMAGAKLFDHVSHMVYTTAVSLVLALIGFAVLGSRFAGKQLDLAAIDTLLGLMKESYNITPWLLLVPFIVIIMVAMKAPAIPGLFIGTLLGGAAGIISQGKTFSDVVGAMMNGVTSETGNEVIDKLLSGGGLTAMFWTLSLIFAALTFGGILERTGMLEVLAKGILNYAKSTGALVTATVLSCIFVNVLAGDQYLSIVLPGKMFKDEYHRRGLAPRNLSRALEDAGTLTSPLVPWNTCGAMMTTYLGVSTFEYFSYCFLNLINPFVSILYGYFGITIMKLEDDPSAPEYKMAKSTAAV